MPPNPQPPATSVNIKASRDAQQQVESCRYRGSRLGWNAGLPAQVACRLAREAGHRVIAHASIYRFIYDQLAHIKDYSWRRCRSATRRRRTALRRATGRWI